MTGKTWKSLALLSLIAATNGVHGHESLRGGVAKQEEDLLLPELEWESAPEVSSFENVEEVNWFVDEHGRRLTSNNPLTELVAQTFVLQFMEAALVFTGLSNELGGDGPFTMMLPWDYEWDRQSYINKYKTSPWRRHLREMVEYCIYHGDMPEDNLPNTITLYMKNGEPLELSVDGERSRVNGFRNIGTTEVSNGFVYLLQDIVTPSFLDYTLYNLVSNDHSLFASLVVGAGWQGNLNSRAENRAYTVFAPTNTAFDMYHPGLYNYLNGNSGERNNFVKFHIVTPVWPRMNLSPGSSSGTSVQTEKGESLTLKLASNGEDLTVRTPNGINTNVVHADKLGYNGIIHVVDQVLRFKNYSGLTAPSATNINTYVRGLINSNLFTSGSYQKEALDFLLTSNGCPNCSDDQYRIKQRFVLACLFYATDNVNNPLTQAYGSTGGRWSARSGWVSGSNECTWYGVSCNDSGYVDYINLRDNNLSGSIPSELTLISDTLEVLDVSKNNVYNDGNAGNNWLNSLTNLKILSVSETGFSYNGIPNLGNLRDLTDLDVSYCLYFGSISGASWFNNLDKVTYLDLSGNSYNSAAPSAIGSMASLKYFYAIDADLTGNLNFITGSSSLEELWIDDNSSLGGSIPGALGNMMSLRSLSLSDNNLGGNIPTQLGRLVNMEQLFLYGNSIGGQVPTHLGNLAKLTRLEIYDNSLNGNIPSQVCNVRNQFGNNEAHFASHCNSCGSCCSCCDCCGNNCRRAGDN